MYLKRKLGKNGRKESSCVMYDAFFFGEHVYLKSKDDNILTSYTFNYCI